MKTKRVSVTSREQIILQTMIYMEIQTSKEIEELGIEPVNSTEELKALYKKIAGFEWKDLG